MLSTLIYTAVVAAPVRFFAGYEEYLEKQKVEDFATYFKHNLDAEFLDENKEQNIEKICNIFEISEAQCKSDYEILGKDLENGEKASYTILDKIIDDKASYDLDKVGEFHNEFHLKELNGILNKYDGEAIVQLEATKMVEIKDYDNPDNSKFYYVKMFSDEINKPYIEEGRLPNSASEITVLPQFLKENNLKIGDNYKIEIGEEAVFSKEYKIVGTAYAPTLPVGVNPMAVGADYKRDTIVYMLDEDFKELGQVKKKGEVVNLIPMTDLSTYSILLDVNKSEINEIDEQLNAEGIGGVNHFRKSTINAPKMEVNSNKTFGLVFSMFVVIITVFVIALMMKKRIENDAKQIGVLKSLGYKSFEISAGYLAFPIVSSLIGVTLGYFIGQVVSLSIISLYEDLYIIPIGEKFFNLEVLFFGSILPFLLVVLVSFIVVVYLLNVRVMDLLKPANKHGVAPKTPTLKFQKRKNKFMAVVLMPITICAFLFKIFLYVINTILHSLQIIILKMLKPFKFKTRLKYSLAVRSLGRLILLFIIVAASSMTMLFSLFSSGMTKNLMDDMFGQFEWDYYQFYNDFYDNELSSEFDKELTLQANVNLINGIEPNKYIESENLNVEKNHFNDGLIVLGVDSNAKYVTLKNKKGDSLDHLLEEENAIIISSASAIKYKLDVGDKFTFNIFGTVKEFEVKGINNSSFDYSIYSSRLTLADIVYNTFKNEDGTLKYTNKEELYNGVYGVGTPNTEANVIQTIDIKTLQEEVAVQTERLDVIIYIMVIIAALISFISIIIIAGFTVEDNFKNISLLKVMGYKKFEILNITLLVYLPIVVLAYLVAVPFTYIILRIMILALTSTLGVELPLRISITDGLLGLAAIVLAYFISMIVGVRALKKITLQEALKEE